VHFFLIEYESGDISQHDSEVDMVSWFSIDEALKKASYRGEKEIIEKAKEKLLGVADSKEVYEKDPNLG
jgi:8-oxo-dGTP diphosphatase